MTDDLDANGDPPAALKSVGERLREARLAHRLDLSDVAQRTRIPLRHLEAIESGNYSSMPTPTYAVGFAKAYARAVGEDEVAIARDVRGDTDVQPRKAVEYVTYDTDEPTKTPSRGVMLAALVAVAAILLVVGLWYGTTLFRGDGTTRATAGAEAAYVPTAAPSVAPTPTAAPTGQVTLVANDEVWLRIYDAAGKTYAERTLKSGERYDVPAGIVYPMINVGRPDKLQVLVNGAAVAPLGDGRVAIKDIGISAAALAARGAGKTSGLVRPSVGGTVAAAPPATGTASPVTTGQRDASQLAAPGNMMP